VTFSGGSLAATNVDSFGIVNPTGMSGFVGETVKGGAQDNGGLRVDDTGNHAPVVTVPAQHTIPVRTPFALTGSATDSDGDALTYLWEQNDRGGATGTTLASNTKVNGPLFRQFGTAAIVSPEDTLKYYSPGENAVNADPHRVFPDLRQIAANNTNAATGTCPAAPPAPTPLPADVRDCYSEFLPTSDWVGIDNTRTMHFRLTARDGRLGGGGVGFGDTALVLAPSAGPFLVTSQGSAQTLRGGSTQPVTWDVAGTDVAPIGVSEVKLSLSVDGGLTFPHVLSERTPNDGVESVTLPDLGTTKGRLKVEAVGNVFFDLNDGDLTIQASPRVANSGPVTVQYSDAAPVTVNASDPDTAGPALAAVATGLPAGLSLVAGATSEPDARPGLRSWTVSGTTTGAPGDYPVSVAVTDEAGIVSTTAFSIRVTPEDAEATYTGDALAFGGSGTPVQLRATVRDVSDATPGDIRTGTVTFVAGSQALCTGPLELLGTEPTAASANCMAKVPAGATKVSVVVGGNYLSVGPGQVDVAPAQRRTVLGSATLTAARSAGAFAAAPGSTITVGIVAGHNGSKPTGVTTVGFESGGKSYQIVAAGAESFGARTGRPALVDLRSRAMLVDVTGSPVVVATGLALRMTGTHNGQPGPADGIGLTLMAGNRLLFSSDWTGARTTESPAATGGLLVI
jgi:hypothetical protein